MLKTKKHNFFEADEKQIYLAPVLQYAPQQDSLIAEERKGFQLLANYLKSDKHPDIDSLIG